MKTSKFVRPRIATAALTLIGAAVATGLSAAPAVAQEDGVLIQTTASGSRSCDAGYVVVVRVDLIDPGNVTFYRGSTNDGTSYGGSYHVHYYSASSVSWKVTAPSGIATVSDYCSRP